MFHSFEKFFNKLMRYDNSLGINHKYNFNVVFEGRTLSLEDLKYYGVLVDYGNKDIQVSLKGIEIHFDNCDGWTFHLKKDGILLRIGNNNKIKGHSNCIIEGGIGNSVEVDNSCGIVLSNDSQVVCDSSNSIVVKNNSKVVCGKNNIINIDDDCKLKAHEFNIITTGLRCGFHLGQGNFLKYKKPLFNIEDWGYFIEIHETVTVVITVFDEIKCALKEICVNSSKIDLPTPKEFKSILRFKK